MFSVRGCGLAIAFAVNSCRSSARVSSSNTKVLLGIVVIQTLMLSRSAFSDPLALLLSSRSVVGRIHPQASVFVYLGDQMRLIVAGQVPTAVADRELFFQDVSLLLQALLGLSVGEEQVRKFSCSTQTVVSSRAGAAVVGFKQAVSPEEFLSVPETVPVECLAPRHATLFFCVNTFLVPVFGLKTWRVNNTEGRSS